MFNGEQLEKISKTFCEELNRDKQPLTQLRALAEYLKYVTQQRKDETNQAEYANIINTIFAEPIKWILKSHHFDSKEFIVEAYSFLLNATKYFVADMDYDNHETAYVLRYLSDSDLTFYRTMTEGEAPTIPSQDSWRKELKAGDLVDTVKEDQKLIGWANATVVQATENTLALQFIGEGPKSKKYIDHKAH